MEKPLTFDLVTCVGKAYQTVWRERKYLLRLAAIPFLLKIIFLTIGYTQGGDESMLRLSLIMVPAWLVEGWMLSHFVRLLMLGQRWPFQPTGDRAVDLPVLQSRYRGVMGGAITFTLIQLWLGGWLAVFFALVPIPFDIPADEVVITPEQVGIACVLFGIGAYFFRFLWLYIPAAGGASMWSLAAALAPGAGISIRMIGVWLLCTVPAMLLIRVIATLALTLMGAELANDAIMVIGILAKVILDLVKNVLCAAVMVYAFQDMFQGKSA